MDKIGTDLIPNRRTDYDDNPNCIKTTQEILKVIKKYGKLLYSETVINNKIQEIAQAIKQDLETLKEEIVMIVIEDGARVFKNRLVKVLGEETMGKIKIKRVRLKSYEGMKSRKKLTITDLNPKISVNWNNILIVEDIVDTGNTLTQYSKKLQEAGANTIKIASLFSKPAGWHKMEIDYPFIEIQWKPFIIGDWLDFDTTVNWDKFSYFRDLPDVYEINNTVLEKLLLKEPEK